MANTKFYKSLRYKLLELFGELAREMPGLELYREWRERVEGSSMPSFYNAIYGLEKRELIKRERRGHKAIFKLTSVGKRKLFIGRVFNNFLKEKKKKWDDKWRIVIFDIPENKRKLRDFLRQELLMNNFKMLQKSVWITPYFISDDFEKLLKEVGLDYYVRYIVADYISYERDLFKHFRFHIRH